MDKIVIAGGSGFIGSTLSQFLIKNGFEVVILSRGKEKIINNVKFITWGGESLGSWINELENAKAVVNLAGRSINCLHTKENREEIIRSRENSIKALTLAFNKCKNPPKVWVQASATGYYGNTERNLLDEESPKGDDFLSDVCSVWEKTFIDASLRETRKVIFRIGVVLGEGGGALKPLTLLTKLFLGGAAGSGEQYISWISIEDLCQIIVTSIKDDKISGTYNATSPNPVTNSQLMKALRHAYNRPWVPGAPAFIVRLIAKFILKTEPSLILKGNKVIPKRLMEYGFNWKNPDLDSALKR